MNPEKTTHENEQLKKEEQAIGEPSLEEGEQETLNKRMADADSELNDLNEDYARSIGDLD